jgi:hypothetical protein
MAVSRALVVLGLLAVAARADALVVCLRRNGDLKVRTACKKHETRVASEQLGLGPAVGPQGTQGPQGPKGDVGPAGPGTDLACEGATGTNLLFSFVTNQAGFDTGMVVANTSKDPFGTTPADGTCVLHFFGANAPANPITSPKIVAGTTYATLASTTAPGFQGYVFAVCDFKYAHGFAFVSDLGARNLAMGYLPLVTCPGRSPAHPEQLLP